MAKYLKNIKSFEDLKTKYREMLKKHHPDNGGDLEVMKEINVEYDALFSIWKSRREAETGETINETAAGTRSEFYTMNGWKGSNYDSKLSLKEIAKIVRTYVKEKYPTCKFSVRTSYASMCQELHVELKEFPAKMFKSADDLRYDGLTEVKTYEKDGETFSYTEYTDEASDMLTKLRRNGYFNLSMWEDEDVYKAYEKAVNDSTFYAIRTEYFREVIEDVDRFVNSYNYSDCDGMIDYFDVNFYYFGCNADNCKQVEKTARIAKHKDMPKTA